MTFLKPGPAGLRFERRTSPQWSRLRPQIATLGSFLILFIFPLYPIRIRKALTKEKDKDERESSSRAG